MITKAELLLAIISALIGVLISHTFIVLIWMIIWLRSIRGPLAGWWEDSIFEGNECVKHDYIRLYHVRSRVVGKVARHVSPDSDDLRRNWYFSGRRDGNELFGIFWEVSRRLPRNVAAFLTQQQDGHFAGRYLRLHGATRDVKWVRIELRRLSGKPDNWEEVWHRRWWNLSWFRLLSSSVLP